MGINLAIENCTLDGPENSQTTASPASDFTCDPNSNMEDSPMEHSKHGHIDSKWSSQIEINIL